MDNAFNCEMANCTMSFEDEEQLTAHKKKHELSLSLTPSSYKNPFILDQTPTPTHFINPVTFELEEFEGQNDNPFEVTFRRANSSNASNTIVMPESSSFIASLPDSEVLNTPSIVLPSEPATPISLKPCILKNIKKKSDNQSLPNEPVPIPNEPFSIPNEPVNKSTSPQQSIEDAELPAESASYPGVEPITLEELSEKVKNKNPPAQKNVLQTSVITSVGNTAILKNNSIGVPTAVVVTRAAVNSVPTVSMTQVVGSQVVAQPVTQLKVQKTIQTVAQPLHLGTVLLSFNVEPQTILQIGNNLPSTVATIAPQVTSSTSNAKMKLKEVLTQNQKGGVNVKKVIATKSKPKPPILIHPDSSDGARMSSSPPSSPPAVRKPGSNGRRRSEFADNPDEKRKRSLERNRAAATRCREKRKMWIKNLEKKADELAETNVQLQSEVNLLRNEVAHLKMLLLEHKDCPVTLQQKSSVHETERETYTTVRIITSASDDIQRVPNISVISPPSSDFMDMEVSSVQSNDSLASETSETSYRER